MTEQHFHFKWVSVKFQLKHTAEAHQSKCQHRSSNLKMLCPGQGWFLLIIQTIWKCPPGSTDACCASSFGIHKQLWRPHQLDGADSKTETTKPQTSKWEEQEDRDSTSQEACKLNRILPLSLSPSLSLLLSSLPFSSLASLKLSWLLFWEILIW